MRIFNKFKGTRGFVFGWERVIRFRYMITEEAKRRAAILAYWKKCGTEDTEKIYEVKERTLYEWQRKLKSGGGKLEALNPGSTIPKVKRKRLWDERILAEIRRLREEHPNLGEKKIYPLLAKFCEREKQKCPKPVTIGRLIHDMGGLRKYPQKVSHFGKIKKANRQKVLRKPKHFMTEYPGHLVALDTIELFVHGMRRYLITFEDIHTRFCFAWATESHASLAAKEFFEHCLKVFPYPISFVLTDNGSEFKKHFDEELRRLHLVHYHTYPRTPKMNAHCERFNRTIQEEFADYHKGLLLEPMKFNEALMDWLLFYNIERVHEAFDNKLSPVQFMIQSPYYQKLFPEKCKVGCGCTHACISTALVYTVSVFLGRSTA